MATRRSGEPEAVVAVRHDPEVVEIQLDRPVDEFVDALHWKTQSNPEVVVAEGHDPEEVEVQLNRHVNELVDALHRQSGSSGSRKA